MTGETSGQQKGSLGARYWRLCSAAVASSLGDGLAFVAFPLLAASLTHDPRLIAGVVAAQRLPWLFFSLPAGAIADRCDRRRLFAVVESARMAALLLLGLAIATHSTTLAMVYGVAFVLGTFETAFAGAAQATLPELVPGDELTRANGYLWSGQMAGEGFIGPAIGGVLFAASAALPFVIDGVSFAASAALLCLALPRRQAVERAEPRATTLRSDIASGVRWFARHPVLRLLAGTVCALAFCQTMCMSVLVIYALRVLHLSRAGFGLLFAAGAVGDVGSGFVAARLHRRFGTLTLIALAGALTGVSYVLLGSTSALPVAVGACVLEALAVGVGNVVTMSVRQRLIPADMQARVGNTFRLCIFGAVPLGAVVGGLIAQSGIHAPFLAAAAIQTTLLALILPRLRRHLSAAATAAEPAIDDSLVIDLRDLDPVPA